MGRCDVGVTGELQVEVGLRPGVAAGLGGEFRVSELLLWWCVQVQTWARSLVYTLEELECKICYNRYDTRSRKPKLLGCLHRVCAKCLKKMVDMGESACCS